MTTQLPDALDPALVIDANTAFDIPYMQSVDAKLQALGGEIVTQRSSPFAWCRPKADPDAAALLPGYGVALKASSAGSDPLMVLATNANVSGGAVPLGVLTEATAPGARGRVAVSGMVPKSVTGITAPGAQKYARANASTGAIELVSSLATTDVAIGTVTADGSLVVQLASPGGYKPSGTSNQVLLGTGVAGNVPAAAIPAPGASTRGGVALPASATNLFLRDDGTFGTPGFVAITPTDADYNLSSAQAANFVFRFSGATLTAYRYVIFPSLVAGRSYWIINDCSGFGLSFKGPTGGYGSIQSGFRGMVVCDGTGFFA